VVLLSVVPLAGCLATCVPKQQKPMVLFSCSWLQRYFIILNSSCTYHGVRAMVLKVKNSYPDEAKHKSIRYARSSELK